MRLVGTECRSSCEKVPAAVFSTAETTGWPVSLLRLDLIGSGIGDWQAVVVVIIVEGQLCSPWDVLTGKEGQLIDVAIVVVVRDGIDGTIRGAGVIDEASRSAHVSSVTDIVSMGFEGPGVPELVIVEEEIVFVFGQILATSVGFIGRDDLSTVRIDKFAP